MQEDTILPIITYQLPYAPRRWPKTLVQFKKKLANSLTTNQKVVFKDHRIVIPRILQTRTLNLAHEPHLGISSMKRRLRTKVWWSGGMDRMIENLVGNCSGCILVSAPETQPITRTEIPDKPWMKIAVDFMKIPGGHHLLVLTDYFSRYIEVVIQSSITAKLTITKLKEIFARFGYPEEILCDKGQPFSSDEFSKFCKSNGIHIKRSVPYAATVHY